MTTKLNEVIDTNEIADTGRKTANGSKIFIGVNQAEFTEQEIMNIKLDLEAGKVMHQAQMTKLIAAQEASTIERHFKQFGGLNSETAEFLIRMGLTTLVKEGAEGSASFRDKYKAKIKDLLKENYGIVRRI